MLQQRVFSRLRDVLVVQSSIREKTRCCSIVHYPWPGPLLVVPAVRPVDPAGIGACVPLNDYLGPIRDAVLSEGFVQVELAVPACGRDRFWHRWWRGPQLVPCLFLSAMFRYQS